VLLSLLVVILTTKDLPDLCSSLDSSLMRGKSGRCLGFVSSSEELLLLPLLSLGGSPTEADLMVKVLLLLVDNLRREYSSDSPLRDFSEWIWELRSSAFESIIESKGVFGLLDLTSVLLLICRLSMSILGELSQMLMIFDLGSRWAEVLA